MTCATIEAVPPMEQLALGWEPERKTYSVAELNARIRGLLGDEFNDVWVSGEISGCRICRLHQLSSQKELNPPGLIQDMSEGQCALFAPGHKPSGHGDLLAFMTGKIVEDRFGVMCPLAAGGIRIQTG